MFISFVLDWALFQCVHLIGVRFSTFLKYVHIGVGFRIYFWARFEIYISNWGSLTLAGLYIEFIAPCPIFQTVDHNLIQSSWRISPVLSWAIIFYGARIWPGVHSINSCPIVHSKVVVLHGKRWLCAVDCWKGKWYCTSTSCIVILRMQVGMTWPPWSGIGFHTASSQHSTCCFVMLGSNM